LLLELLLPTALLHPRQALRYVPQPVLWFVLRTELLLRTFLRLQQRLRLWREELLLRTFVLCEQLWLLLPATLLHLGPPLRYVQEPVLRFVLRTELLLRKELLLRT